jgi:hypothetical protein
MAVLQQILSPMKTAVCSNDEKSAGSDCTNFFPGNEQESAVLRCSGCESAACLIHGFAHYGFSYLQKNCNPCSL